MLRLRLLGAPALEDAAGHMPTGVTGRRRAVALLALLAVRAPRPVNRETLIALLWPDSDEPHARHALAQLLYLVRRELPPGAVAADALTLGLDPAHVAVDVLEFEEALAESDLVRAAALAAGPFLDGFHLPGSVEFAGWVEGERARLATATGRCYEALATAAAHAGERGECVGWWRRYAALEPTNERVADALLVALHAAGDAAGAASHARIFAALTGHPLAAAPGRPAPARAPFPPPAIGRARPPADAAAPDAPREHGAQVMSRWLERLGAAVRSLGALDRELAREIGSAFGRLRGTPSARHLRTSARHAASPPPPAPGASAGGQAPEDGTFYRDLFEQAPEPYLVTDPAGTILRCNRAAAELDPRADGTLVGARLDELLPPAERDGFRRAVQVLGDAHGPSRLVLPLRLRAVCGEREGIWARAAVSVARDEAGRVALLRWLLHLLGEPGVRATASSVFDRRAGGATALYGFGRQGPGSSPVARRRDEG